MVAGLACAAAFTTAFAAPDRANQQLLLDGGSAHQRSVLHPLLLSRRHEAVRRRNDLLLRLSGYTPSVANCGRRA